MSVTRLEQVTPEFLAALLGREVRSVTASPIGTGQMGSTFRLALAGGGPLPPLVGKFAAADAFTRATALAQGSYLRETGFYRDLWRPGLPTPVPRHVALDPATQDFALILDDQPGAAAGDQLRPLALAEAEAAVDAMVALHRAFWGDEALLTLAYLPGARDHAAAPLDPLYDALWPTFLERYGERATPAMRAVGEAYRGRCDAWAAARPGPKTLVHGDFRHDNLLFGPSGVVVVDWQTAAVGSGATDLAYFAGTSLAPALRRVHEAALFARWADALGQPGLDRGQLWHSYRRSAFAGFLMGVAASMIVARTERGDAMFLCMCERAAAMVTDHAAASLL